MLEYVHKTEAKLKEPEKELSQLWINGKIIYLRPLVIVAVRGGTTGEVDGVGLHS